MIGDAETDRQFLSLSPKYPPSHFARVLLVRLFLFDYFCSFLFVISD